MNYQNPQNQSMHQHHPHQNYYQGKQPEYSAPPPAEEKTPEPVNPGLTDIAEKDEYQEQDQNSESLDQVKEENTNSRNG